MRRLHVAVPELKIGDRVQYTSKILVQKRQDISKPPTQGTVIGFKYLPPEHKMEEKKIIVKWDKGSLLKTDEDPKNLVKV